MTPEILAAVEPDQGSVPVALFHDAGVYRRELERVFASCWLYLGHESEVREVGDYLTTSMGEDPVILVRSPDGLHAFLNSCRHRGAKLCRADQGTTRALRCPYHGWTYGLDGKLFGVPRRNTAYFHELPLEELGLLEVAQLESVHGLVFATWDPQAPPLREYLGDFMPYLDLMLDRSPGGVEVIGGVHKWTMATNWKIPAENFCGDQYHLTSTHGSSVEVGLRNKVTEHGHTIHVAGGHSFVRERGGAQAGSAAVTEYTRYVEEMRERIAQEKGAAAAEFVPVGVGTIFPNLSFMDSVRFRTLRIWQPRGPHSIDVSSWCLVDAELPPELKQAAMRQYILSFGPSGMFEQDDGEIWTSIAEATSGYIGRQQSFNYRMGLGHETPVRDAFGIDMPGVVGDSFMTEANHRGFYRHYKELMSA